MLRPEMNLPERSEFSSQALLLIRFQILYFSQIPEWNKNPASRISVPFYPGNSEYFSVFSCFLKFGIVGDTADWICAENSGIPPIIQPPGIQVFSDASPLTVHRQIRIYSLIITV